MAYTDTKDGYNMYDMISMMQKAIRRSDYEHAGFAADQVSGKFRKVMWNRLLMTSAEDCYGVLTKEIVALKKADDEQKNDRHVSDAVALMCKSLKSRDACYFACNFVLASRCPRTVNVEEAELERLEKSVSELKKKFEQEERYDESGFQMSIFGMQGAEALQGGIEHIEDMAILQKAIKHLDMDMIGYEMDVLRKIDRDLIWYALIDCAPGEFVEEFYGLREADRIVNHSRKEADEIFTSKAVMIMCQAAYGLYPNVGCRIINEYDCIDWSQYKVKPVHECKLDGRIPDWVFDCHTLKGKRMGKTDWDMTRDEQEALEPKKKAFFDDASWLYTYEQDWESGDLPEWLWNGIKEFAETHEVNPVDFIPYDD